MTLWQIIASHSTDYPTILQCNHYNVLDLYIFEDISVILCDISAVGHQLHKLIAIEKQS